jgi:hypothetical protein
MGDTLWEKALIVGACLIAAAFMAIVAKREFFDSSSNPPAETAQSTLNEEGNAADGGREVSEVAGSSRSASSADEPVSSQRRTSRSRTPTPVPPERHDCALLKGQHDRTRAERRWYIDNCLFLARKARAAGAGVEAQADNDIVAQLQAAGFTLDESAPRRAVQDAAATPTSDLTADVAVAMAVDWIPANTPVMVSVAAGDCTPIWLNGHWVVTCNVTLEGCAVTYCMASLSVCVFPTEPAVVPDRFC